MGDRLVAIAMPERRSKSRGVVEQFNTLNITTVPEEYRPILDILQTYFSVRDAQPLDRMSSDQRHRVVEAILRRIQNEREGLERRQSASTESIATNAFLMNRLYYLKEVVAALLGGGLVPEDIDGILTRGERVVCRSMAGLEIRRPVEIAPLFGALQYVLTGPSGEAAWAAATDVSSVSLSNLVCGIGGAPPSLRIDPIVAPLLNLYWGILLRGTPNTPRQLKTIPNIQVALTPLFDRIFGTYVAGNPIFDLVDPPLRTNPAAYTLENALRLYTQNRDNLSALLEYLRARTKVDADAAANYRGGSLDICRICGAGGAAPPGAPVLSPAAIREATSLIVVKMLHKMLTTR
jgi:hypothetical protein